MTRRAPVTPREPCRRLNSRQLAMAMNWPREAAACASQSHRVRRVPGRLVRRRPESPCRFVATDTGAAPKNVCQSFTGTTSDGGLKLTAAFLVVVPIHANPSGRLTPPPPRRHRGRQSHQSGSDAASDRADRLGDRTDSVTSRGRPGRPRSATTVGRPAGRLK